MRKCDNIRVNNMANTEFGTGKTVIILTIVAACFAVLWPKIFYPMLIGGGPALKTQPSVDSAGCCDVIFETDINAIRVMTEVCEQILRRHDNPRLAHSFKEGKLTNEVVSACRTEVQNLCGIDIAQFLSEKVRLGASYRQILDEIRSFNISLCLRRHFGVTPGALGASRIMRIWGPTVSRHLRQERPLHLRPEMMHPALRERGRAVPTTHVVPNIAPESQPVHRPPPPLPGMRPPMGAAGHVVPPPKTGGTMGIVMPLYTIGIVVFFMYTIMKVFVRKSVHDDRYKDFEPDPEFRRVVFAEENEDNSYTTSNGSGLRIRKKETSPPLRKIQNDVSTTRLDWKERDTRDLEIDHLRKRLEETERAMERIVAQMGNLSLPASLLPQKRQTLPQPGSKEENLEDIGTEKPKPDSTNQVNITEIPEILVDDGPKVKVLGLETRAQCEEGHTWHRPPTPNLGGHPHSRCTTPLPPATPEPTNIYLTGTLPQQSQLLVEDAEIRAETPTGVEEGAGSGAGAGVDPPVILTGKMTLSLISVADNGIPVQNDDVIEPESFADPDSTLLDVDSALIDESNVSSTGKKSDIEKIDDETFTHYTSAEEDADIEDTAADISAIHDQDDLADEYNQIWSNIEAEGDDQDIELHNDDIADVAIAKIKD